MKKLFILIIVILVSISGFAQKSSHKYALPVNGVSEPNTNFFNSTSARTTTIGDTVKLSNIAAADTPYVIYSAGADSGYLTGTDYWQDSAFAERYDFNGEDSSVSVIGVFAQFAGKVNPASTKTISINVWNVTPQQYVSGTYLYSGFPDSVILSDTVALTQLGIGTANDTLKAFMFNNATTPISYEFFVGYSMSYNFSALAGDTIGLASSLNGDRTSPITTLQVFMSDIDTVVDTIVNVQNATLWGDGNWHDNYTDNDSLSNDLAIFPIVVTGTPTGVKGITRKNLTFYGCYPNPAVNITNIKFSLAKPADVTLQITDMTGRIMNTITQSNLATGEHIIPVNTSALTTGDYLYLIRTSGGDGIASKFTKTPNP
jgi:hypothetical protein